MAEAVKDAVSAREKYGLRLKRRRLLWRSFRSRHQLTPLQDRTREIARNDILGFSCVRNEAQRLPYWLAHYRRLGVRQFLIVDNGSDDGTVELLRDQPDVSLWQTRARYRDARFGVDWLTWLQMRYGKRHWCLTVDADEVFIYPEWEDRDLCQLTAWLDRTGREAFGALMLELYPKGPIGAVAYEAGMDPTQVIQWFDGPPRRVVRQAPMQNLWVQGGVRERVFFADQPRLSPTLNKLPLVKWHWRYAYFISTHSILPARLNLAFDGPGGAAPSGVLLHTKFLDSAVTRAGEEKARGEHFSYPKNYEAYYDAVSGDPVLWHEASLRYEGWAQLEALGFMNRGGWAG